MAVNTFAWSFVGALATIGTLFAGESARAEAADAELIEVCRATAAAMHSKAMETVDGRLYRSQIAQASWTRESDKTLWKIACRIEGNRVVWASLDLDGPNSGLGRWRVSPDDEVVRFSISSEQIKISQVFSDGSALEDTFERGVR